jgi:hypothetical protein
MGGFLTIPIIIAKFVGWSLIEYRFGEKER